MAVLGTIAVIGFPIGVSILWSIRSYASILHDPVLGVSPRLVRGFIAMRSLYWIAFGILLTAFAVAFVIAGGNGEATRTMLLLPHTGTYANDLLNAISSMLAGWRFPFVVASLLGILASIVFLFLIGREGLRLIPEDSAPTPEFLKARARFFFLGLSLMIPPLLLSLFLSL